MRNGRERGRDSHLCSLDCVISVVFVCCRSSHTFPPAYCLCAHLSPIALLEHISLQSVSLPLDPNVRFEYFGLKQQDRKLRKQNTKYIEGKKERREGERRKER